MKRIAPVVPAALLSLSAASPAASQDYDAMGKWSDAKVVHYKITGDFAGKMRILGGEHTIRSGMVSDHVEFEFDWDNQEMKLIGTPLLRNAATQLGEVDPAPTDLGSCPPVRISRPPEFATVTQVTALSVLVTVEFSQRSAEGALPWAPETGGGKCGDLWDSSAAGEGTGSVSLQLPPGMMLFMPPEQTGYGRSKDGKSLVTRPENGWVWVITPTIVK